MTQPMSTVVLMCGPPGAGKTTYAMALVRRGYVRLSIDEVVWRRIGGRDAGLVLADRATLERRLAVRNREEGANAVTVDEGLLNRYLADFEEPDGEGEQVWRQTWG